MNGVKIVHKHRKGCRALEYVSKGTWATPWSYPRLLWRDRAGGKRSNMTLWLSIRCNTTDCPGLLMVKNDDLLALLPPA